MVERRLDPRPSTARVRFSDGARDYQTGSVLARTAGDGGSVDLDLPAVCAPTLATAAAERALIDGAGERLTIALGPLDALRMEPGDVVTVGGRDGLWRAKSVDLAEQASATFEPVRSVRAGADHNALLRPAGGDGVGAPFLRLLDLPPLPDAEDEARPLVAAAAEPWRAMQVRAGPSVEALTVRAEVSQPATVGQLTSTLGPGPRYRWDTLSALTVRMEGRAPQSRGQAAVLAGANSLAIETAAGWEILQFRQADLLGGDVWRLTGLLRGQQGTEQAMMAGADPGAVVVCLEANLPRAAVSRSERGLPLVWRAGPVGVPGGDGVRELGWTPGGRHECPWSPAHLRRKARADGSVDLSWIPRSRLDGDRWDGETASADATRFRVRILRAAEVIRTFEVEACIVGYEAAELLSDFPGGLPDDVEAAVSQWGEHYGWGDEATVRL